MIRKLEQHSNMRSFTIATFLTILFFASWAHTQSWIEWKIKDGGNGHYYALTVQQHFSWENARTEAREHASHLVTITGQAEQDFVAERFLNEHHYG